MASWSWLKWPDAIIDYGMQLYLAWQLVEGKSLYTDIAYAYGPIAPYTMALGFRLFGIGLTTLVGLNLAVLCLITILLYWMMLKIGSAFSATAAILVFLTVFAFAQMVAYGNYNYVTPYETNVTFGMLFCLVAIVGLVKFVETRSAAGASASGFFLGCAFLTKPELFLAGACAWAGGIVLLAWIRGCDRRLILGTFVATPAAFLIAPAISIALLASKMSLEQAVLGTFGSWTVILHHDASAIPFYRGLMGTDDTVGNAWLMAKWSFAYGAVFGASAYICLLWKRSGDSKNYFGINWLTVSISGALLSLATLSIIATNHMVNWSQIGRPLPLLLLISIGAAMVFLRDGRDCAQIANRMIIRLIVMIFSLVLLLKMIVAVRFYHYGFALAMPAMLVFVTLLLDWIPGWIDGRKGRGNAFRAVGIWMLLFVVLNTLALTSSHFTNKHVMIAGDRDRFWGDERGIAVNIVLEEIEKYVRTDQTLVPVPEGVMINYLSRRTCPIPYLNLNPPNFIFYGERTILASFQEHRPDFILIAHKDTSEFGYQYFGRDYAKELFAWIRRNYEGLTLIGERPHHNGYYGMLLMRRRDLKPRT